MSRILRRLTILLVLGAAALWAYNQYSAQTDGRSAGEKIKVVAQSAASHLAPELFPPSPEQAASEADFSCRVSRISDGDTLRCADGTRVRLHAISALETNETCSPGHPCANMSAAESTETLRELVAGQTLDCMTTGQSYNRVTAICWTPQRIEVNCYMVEAGAAAIWDRYDRETRICRDKRRFRAALG